jgi:L-aminopeptidase/D-esterase-like protein
MHNSDALEPIPAVVRGHRDPTTGAREDITAVVESQLAGGVDAAPGNTTLPVVVTNQKLAPRSRRRLGRQVHSSMARGIQPFQTGNDGGVLFTATTGDVDEELDDLTLGVVASELAWDAVLTCFSRETHPPAHPGFGE